MIEQLVAALEKKRPDLTAEDIADILWLTLQQWQSESSQMSQSLAQDVAHIPAGEMDSSEGNPPPSLPLPSLPADDQKHPPSPMAGVTTSLPSQGESTAPAPGASLAIPSARSLRRSLEILKALRPLIRQVPSPSTTYLDVPATVQTIAETRLWLLQLRPVPEPWLELAIVVDAAPSMAIWQRTILDLRRVLAQSGVFRDVRLWSLEAQAASGSTTGSARNAKSKTKAKPRSQSKSAPASAPTLVLRSGFGTTTAAQPPCRPQELLDPNRRRLILVASDCIAPHWDTQPLRDLLQVWAERGPMALLQVLPEWLWNRTALLEVARGQLFSRTPGQTNQSLTFVRRGRGRRRPAAGLKVPVLTLEPAVAHRWSQMVAGKTAVAAPGLLFSPVQVRELAPPSAVDGGSAIPPHPSPLTPHPSPLTPHPSKPSPQERLQQFRDFSSPLARHLAGLLAACPEVTLPIVRLVRDAMLPDSQQVHVAEVLLGGLFKPQVDASAHTPEDRLHYEFHPSVRPLVQDTIPPERLFQTLSLWLHHRFGCSLEDFRAYLLTEGTARVKPFAGILLELLKRRGHQYADIIADIEQVYRPQYSSFAQLSQQEQANQDYQIRVRPGTSGIAVLAIHGGNLQPGTTEIAAAIAGEKHAFYSFVSRKPEIDQSLYLSSTQFDEPAALEMVRNARTVLSIHGAQGSDEFVLLEGLDRDRRDLIRAELTKADFSVLKKEYPGGIDPDNICNRGRTGKGVQLEISRGLRDRFLQGDRETSRFNAFIAIVQRCLETAIFDEPEAANLNLEPSPLPVDLTWADFPPLETLEFRTAQLVDTLESPSFPPPLATETFQIATLSFSFDTIYRTRLQGQGQATKLLDGSSEFQSNTFWVTLREHALRLFGGLADADTANHLVEELFGDIRGSATVGLLAMNFQESNLILDTVGQGVQPVVYTVEGELRWLLMRPLEDVNQRDTLKKLIAGLTRFAMVLGGFGESWQRANHRLFLPDYGEDDYKPLIGCHWQWLGDLALRQDVRVRKLEQVGEFIESVRQTARTWMQQRGVVPQPNQHASWREIWHPDTVQVWGRQAEEAEDCEAIRWLHGPYRDAIPTADIQEGSIYRSSLSSQVGTIIPLWHRMYPRVRLVKDPQDPKGKPLAKHTREYFELLTLFPDGSPESDAFLTFLESEQRHFQRLWPFQL